MPHAPPLGRAHSHGRCSSHQPCCGVDAKRLRGGCLGDITASQPVVWRDVLLAHVRLCPLDQAVDGGCGNAQQLRHALVQAQAAGDVLCEVAVAEVGLEPVIHRDEGAAKAFVVGAGPKNGEEVHWGFVWAVGPGELLCLENGQQMERQVQICSEFFGNFLQLVGGLLHELDSLLRHFLVEKWIGGQNVPLLVVVQHGVESLGVDAWVDRKEAGSDHVANAGDRHLMFMPNLAQLVADRDAFLGMGRVCCSHKEVGVKRLHVHLVTILGNAAVEGHRNKRKQGQLVQKLLPQRATRHPVSPSLSRRHANHCTGLQMWLKGVEDTFIGESWNGHQNDIDSIKSLRRICCYARWFSPDYPRRVKVAGELGRNVAAVFFKARRDLLCFLLESCV
mmetsp:Transcript_30428/g.76425  ORF Transcript_30428/g.76425 Transcript_30428/m.76425 type:complete len:391 (-) Transcript_30428:252-1424(-)